MERLHLRPNFTGAVIENTVNPSDAGFETRSAP